jgi:hypothetical protein
MTFIDGLEAMEVSNRCEITICRITGFIGRGCSVDWSRRTLNLHSD